MHGIFPGSAALTENVLIILTSTDYWNINYEEVNGSLRMWEELVRDVEAGKRDEIKNTREKEECHGEKTL